MSKSIILKILAPILMVTFFLYLPFLANKKLLLERSNDLEGFFWPIIYYIKESILIHKQIPLWNNLFFMGTPLVSDPQNLYWYLPNIIFLIFPIDTGIILTYFIHSLFGGFGMYLAARQFKFSQNASVITACLFIITPKLASYLEAGHFGLVLSFTYLPWVIYTLKKLVNEPKPIWSVILAFCLSAIYVNHILTAFLTLSVSLFFALILFLQRPKTKTIWYGLLAGILFAAIISPIVYVQQQWFGQTTRDMLLNYPDVYPKWDTELEFLQNLIILKRIETEKILLLGTIPTLLAIIGFFKLKLKVKIALVSTGLAIFLIALNNLSPIYNLLISWDWYVLLRVSTRPWFILTLIAIFLMGYGFEVLEKKNKAFAYTFVIIAIGQSLFICYKIFSKPIIVSQQVPTEIYEYLNADKDHFRVFCTTRCLAQKQSAIYGLKLAEGYGTLQQKNYYQAALAIGQYYSDKYSLSIPPFDVYLYQDLQPKSEILARYGIKYVVSPHKLTDSNLLAVKESSGYMVYQNKFFRPITYLYYSPNIIEIENNEFKDNLIIPEIYNSNWKAFNEFSLPLSVSQSDDHLLKISTQKSRVVVLKFIPFR